MTTVTQDQLWKDYRRVATKLQQLRQRCGGLVSWLDANNGANGGGLYLSPPRKVALQAELANMAKGE